MINASRGDVVVMSAVIDALRNDELAGAAFDVYEKEPLPKEHELRRMLAEGHNLFLAPHSAFYTETVSRRMQEQVAEQMIRVLVDGGLPHHLVNPQVLGK